MLKLLLDGINVWIKNVCLAAKIFPQAFNFHQMSKLRFPGKWLLLIFIMSFSALYAQEPVLKGVVTEDLTGNPLAGVMVAL